MTGPSSPPLIFIVPQSGKIASAGAGHFLTVLEGWWAQVGIIELQRFGWAAAEEQLPMRITIANVMVAPVGQV